MYILEVIADKLNIRNTPYADPEFGNWVGEISKGDIFNAARIVKGGPYEGSNDWYADDGGTGSRYVAASQLRAVSLDNWCLKNLGINQIWETYNERGQHATIAILDTGYNTQNQEIKNGVYFEMLAANPTGKLTIKDSDGHGTMCASLIGARNTNFTIGCAPSCRMHVIKIAEKGKALTYALMVKGIEIAIEQGAQIISISGGGALPNDELHTAIKKATDNNMIVVAAIGDNIGSGGLNGYYPARYDECIAVGSTDVHNQVSSFSVRNQVDICAPGENMHGYLQDGFTPQNTGRGTSQATAIVAGICSLIISWHHGRKISYTNQSIKQLITKFSDSIITEPDCRLISPLKIFNHLNTQQ